MSVYRPQGAIREIFSTNAREVLLEGGTGTGKTRGLLELVVMCCFRYPRSHWLFARQKREHMAKSVLTTLERDVLPVGSPIIGGLQREGRRVYRFPNGSRIDIGGLQDIDDYMSTDYDGIVVFEARQSYPVTLRLLTRLRGTAMPTKQIWFDTNPSAPQHYLNQRALAGKMHRIRTTHRDNPLFYDAERGEWTKAGRAYMDTLDALPEIERLRHRDGLWVAGSGMVYKDFRDATHVVRSGQVPYDGWQARRVIIGIDDGTAEAFSAHRYEIDHDGRMFAAREVYAPGLSMQERCEAVERLGGRNAEIVYDAAAAALGLELRRVFRDVRPCNKGPSIVDGINMLSSRLRLAMDGLPRFWVSEDCPAMIQEFGEYEWKTNREDLPKDQPKDENNHALDEARYVTVELDYRLPAIIAGSRGDPDDVGAARDAWLDESQRRREAVFGDDAMWSVI